MIEPPAVKRSLVTKLDKLRLLVAQEIICNRLNTNGTTDHIRSKSANSELCEQYCLKIYLTWLATKYGFPICTSAIQAAWQGILTTPGGWPQWSDRYPFYGYFDRQFEAGLFQTVCAHLDREFSACIESAGDLYIRMLAAPLLFDDDGRPFINGGGKQRRGGEFYTAPGLVDYCLAEAGWNFKGRLLDPACGTGNFLLGALDASKNRLATVGLLHGFDVDGKAVAIARALLAIACSGDLAAQPSAVSEVEFSGQLAKLHQQLDQQVRVVDAVTLDNQGKFDFVITNPPYLSFGSRNQQAMAPGHDRYLRLKFPASSQYKIRLHSVFQEICLRQAAAGGQVVLLLPDAFLTGAYYLKLRQLITREAEIIGFTELPEATFADATAGRWCIAHYRKKGAGEGQPSIISLTSFDKSWQSRKFAMPQAALVSADKHRFRLLFDSADLKVVQSLESLNQVASRFQGHTGIRARHGQASIVGDQERGSNWKRGIVSGGQVKAHRIKWSGHFLNIEKSLLFAGGFDQRIISQPKVLVRQTADRLIGALDTGSLYHLNNVHAFAPIAAPSLDSAAFFAALINSRLWLYLYRLKSREEKRALAQIDIEMVECLPLPKENCFERLIAGTVGTQNELAPNTLAAIDRLIYDMYALDTKQVEHIETVIAKGGERQPLPSSYEAVNLLESLVNATV